MAIVIKSRLVRVGNSQGIRIPKAVLDQVGLVGAVELEAHEDHLIIRPLRQPRLGWEEQFRAMAERGDDQLIDPAAGASSRWDTNEWEW